MSPCLIFVNTDIICTNITMALFIVIIIIIIVKYNLYIFKRRIVHTFVTLVFN